MALRSGKLFSGKLEAGRLFGFISTAVNPPGTGVCIEHGTRFDEEHQARHGSGAQSRPDFGRDDQARQHDESAARFETGGFETRPYAEQAMKNIYPGTGTRSDNEITTRTSGAASPRPGSGANRRPRNIH